MIAFGDSITHVNTKHRSTLRAIFARPTPATIRFDSLEKLVVALHGEVIEGAGSRVGFALNGLTAFFHRPHPGREAKRYAVREFAEFLVSSGTAEKGLGQ
jgi:hypothetical protein